MASGRCVISVPGKAVTIDLVAAARLSDRMWELRRNATGYDAA